MKERRFHVLSEDDSDPMLSSVNLVDVFLVAMVMMAISLLSNPMIAPQDADYTMIRDAGKPTMEITVKQGKRLKRFDATGSSSEGNGVRAGIAYQMQDGTMVYVPTDVENAPRNEQSGDSR